jgi:DNA-binding NtrC family response regulator
MLAADLRRPEAFADLITASERMRVLFRFIEAVAPSTEPILLFGETGTGKELFAQAVHRASEAKGPFVATNLGGLDDQMVADTLFGHSKGAFTGADQARKGLVSTAAEGTLFLDEIGDLSPSSQVKLLRFLENREYYPLGSDVVRRSSARVVAATNRDLETLATEGKFRQDLIYRLSVFRIDVPPLRERPEDIPLLSQHFLDTLGSGSTTLSSGAMALLRSYHFPGNVRELRGLLLRAMAVSPGKIIDRPVLEGLLKSHANLPPAPSTPPRSFPTIRQAIDELVAEAMARTNGHQAQAALLLGITPQALSKRLRRRGGSPEV